MTVSEAMKMTLTEEEETCWKRTLKLLTFHRMFAVF